jgi:hypothetical protein
MPQASMRAFMRRPRSRESTTSSTAIGRCVKGLVQLVVADARRRIADRPPRLVDALARGVVGQRARDPDGRRASSSRRSFERELAAELEERAHQLRSTRRGG